MNIRPYTNARVSKDGQWHVVIDTPTVIATPDGAISISWNGTDPKYRERAEVVAAEIVIAMNGPAARIRQLEAERDALTTELARSPLAAVAMRDAALRAARDVAQENDDAGWEDMAAGAKEVVAAIDAIPLDFTPADLLAAARQVPEVAALIDAAKPYTSVMQDADFGRQMREYEALQAALAAIGGA